MLRPRQPPRSRQRNVDCLGSQRRAAPTPVLPRAQSRVQQPFHHSLQRVEAHAQQLLGLRRSGLQPPSRNLVQPSLLAPQPLQPKGLHSRIIVQRSRGRPRLPLQPRKCLVQRSLIKCRQIGNLFVHRLNQQDKSLALLVAVFSSPRTHLAPRSLRRNDGGSSGL